MPCPFDTGLGEVLEVVALTRGSATTIRLRGEAELASLDVLSDCLTRLEPTSSDTLQPDLPDLRFCDVAALRELAQLGGQAGAGQRTSQLPARRLDGSSR